MLYISFGLYANDDDAHHHHRHWSFRAAPLVSPCALARTETLDSPAPPCAWDELIAEPVGAARAGGSVGCFSASVAHCRLEWKCFCRQSNRLEWLVSIREEILRVVRSHANSPDSPSAQTAPTVPPLPALPRRSSPLPRASCPALPPAPPRAPPSPPPPAAAALARAPFGRSPPAAPGRAATAHACAWRPIGLLARGRGQCGWRARSRLERERARSRACERRARSLFAGPRQERARAGTRGRAGAVARCRVGRRFGPRGDSSMDLSSCRFSELGGGALQGGDDD